MALSCPTRLDVKRLRTEISFLYARVAANPESDFHFHRGPDYAVHYLGYDPEELAEIPREAKASFAGVGNPHAVQPMEPGATVLDVGCGTGMDLLLAARSVGPGGRAIGVDMTPAMAERARAGARAAGLGNVEVRLGDALELPLDTASIDVVISNGVLNLTPDKEQAFREIHRVLRPGARLQFADIVVASDLSEDIRSDIDLWTG